MSYNFVISTGTIIPDTADLNAEVVAEFKAAFGQDLITTANTPQGVLIAGEVTSRAAAASNNAALANQINPMVAGGVFLDALWALTGGGRFAARPSICRGVTLTGLPDTFIPAGSQARTTDGILFESVTAVTLTGGTASVDFQAVIAGPVDVAVGALDTPVTGILGWDSVSNPDAAEIGRAVEPDVASRLRRKNTLALQGVALPESIVSALYALPGVRSLAFLENYEKYDRVIDTIYLLGSSIWACVDGGTDAEIAGVLLSKKSLGGGYNGAVMVNLLHPATGQVYSVRFDRPLPVPVAVRVTVKPAAGSAGDIAASVRRAVMDYASGLTEGEPGFTVGANVSPFEIAAAVNQSSPSPYVKKVELSHLPTIEWLPEEIGIDLKQKATLSSGNIEVIIE